MSVASIAFPERLDMRCYHGHAFGRGRRSRGTAVGRVDPLHGDRACRLLNRSCAAACADYTAAQSPTMELDFTEPLVSLIGKTIARLNPSKSKVDPNVVTIEAQDPDSGEH